MFGKLFAKKEPLTFKARVEKFWTWFAREAQNYRQVLNAERPHELVDETSLHVDALSPGLAWEYGPGAHASEHSLTVSGEGNPHLQLLTQFWLCRAPELRNWTFHAARQPLAGQSTVLKFGGTSFDSREVWVTPTVNKERENFDLAVWHPRLHELNDNQSAAMLFLYLDNILGEYGTSQWIGNFGFSDTALKEAIPLNELSTFITSNASREGWKLRVPGEQGTVYRLPGPHQRFPRGDVVVGATMFPRLLEDYLASEGELDDPLADSGADYVYLAIEKSHFPRGEEASKRGVYEDAIDARLRARGSGRLLGGSFGTDSAYIDLLIFDGSRSLEIIETAMRETGAPRGTELHYFAAEKRKNVRRIT